MSKSILEDVQKNFNTSNLYKVLSVPKESQQHEIKKAYLQRSRELHPDKTTDPDQKEQLKVKFQTLAQVYDLLSCPKRRAEYDQRLYVDELSKYGADSTNFHNQVQLADCDELDDCYYYQCRCSGRFVLPKNVLNAHVPSIAIVDCDSCSNSLKICS